MRGDEHTSFLGRVELTWRSGKGRETLPKAVSPAVKKAESRAGLEWGEGTAQPAKPRLWKWPLVGSGLEDI